MKLARAECADVPGLVIGVAVVGEQAVELGLPPSSDPLLQLLAGNPDWALLDVEVKQRLESGDGVRALAALRLLAPLRRPAKIIAVGLNYADHTSETGLEAPAEPLTFAKYPSSITDPGAAVVVPSAITNQVDWEAELAVVIGRRCGPAGRATMGNVAGYTVANDISARDLQFRDSQWTRGKSLDTFCPLGPMLVTPDEIADPHALRIWASVNGAPMQDASTADMIFDIPTLLAFISATVTLEPGDVILTGTPPGVGGFRSPPVFLQDGDVVSVGVEGIGELTNPIQHT